MKKKEETDYVIPMLRKYGNTIVAKDVVEKIGKELFLAILKAKGLDCVLEEPSQQIVYKANGGNVGAKEIWIVRIKWQSEMQKGE